MFVCVSTIMLDMDINADNANIEGRNLRPKF